MFSCGNNIEYLFKRAEGTFVLKLHRDRVYYMSERLFGKVNSIPRKMLISAGTLLGKMTHSNRFRLQISALDVLAKLCPNKVWLKPGGEQSFLYGMHAVKAHVAKMTDGIEKNQPVIALSENDVPLGFGTISRATADCARAHAEAIVVYNQADTGEFLRHESEIF